MPRVAFSQNIRSHIDLDFSDVEGTTVREAMESAFLIQPRLRGYLFDDDGSVRKHIAFIVNSEPIRDRDHLSDSVSPSDEIFVMQALSGG